MPAATKSKKSGRTAKKSISKSARGQSAAKDRQEKTNSTQAAAVAFFSALLFAAVIYIPGEHIWRTIHGFFFGLFGICAYLYPPVMIYISVSAALNKPAHSVKIRFWEMIALIVSLASLLHIILVGTVPAGSPQELYSTGVALRSGGITGGLIGGTLCSLFGRAGAVITVLLVIAVFTVLLFEISIARVIAAVLRPFIQLKQRRPAEKLPEAQEAQVEKEKKKKGKKLFDVDLFLDSCAPPEEEKDDPAEKVQENPDIRETSSEPPQENMPDLDSLVHKATGAISQRSAVNPEQVHEQTAPLQAANESRFAENGIKDGIGTMPIDDRKQQPEYVFPSAGLLSDQEQASSEDVSEELKGNAARLVDTLRSFGVETRIIDICRGPAVTRYELQPSAGVKISKITSLADDIALNLASAGVRIEAPIPNKSAVGIEVPNKTVTTVRLREIIDSSEFNNAKSRLSVALGRDIAGKVAIADIGKMPHTLIAGATGSGKSVCINTIIMSILYKSRPEEVKLLLVDPKVVELGVYNGIPHLLVPVVTDPRKAAGALNWAVQEMLNRYKLFADNNVRDLKGYNILAAKTDGLQPMPNIVIIIDELADLMMAAPKEVEESICRLAQMARAAGMHLVIATQRPSVDIITGVIKANIPSRIAFAVSSQVDSRTILDSGGAEKLLGRGDMLFLPMGAAKPTRIQGCFVTDEEVESVIGFIKRGAEATYDEDVIDEIEKQAVSDNAQKEEKAGGDADVMLPQAIECVVESGMASTSLLQRRLKLGYARAARIVDQMEQRGIVGPYEGSKPRQVLISRQQWIEMTMNREDGE